MEGRICVMPSDVLLAVPSAKNRGEIADLYALMLASNADRLGELDVSALNRAIIARWSLYALRWIKVEAWKRAIA